MSDTRSTSYLLCMELYMFLDFPDLVIDSVVTSTENHKTTDSEVTQINNTKISRLGKPYDRMNV